MTWRSTEFDFSHGILSRDFHNNFTKNPSEIPLGIHEKIHLGIFKRISLEIPLGFFQRIIPGNSSESLQGIPQIFFFQGFLKQILQRFLQEFF